MDPSGLPAPAPSPERPDPALSWEGRYRSAMVRRFGLLYWLCGLGILLRRLRLEEHSAENIRQAASRGPVVYALHTPSLIDWLALNRVLNGRRLPLAAFSLGIRSTWFQPFIEAVREIKGAFVARLRGGKAPDPVDSGWLAEAVSRGLTTCVFLVPERDIVSDALGVEAPDPISALVEAQARSSAPVQVVPVVVAWHRRPELARTEVARVLLGSQDEPGTFQKLWNVLTRTSVALVQAGEPLDLRELLERYKAEPPARQVRAARILLRRYLYRESHVIRGPRIRPLRWMRRLVLHSPEVQRLVTEEARATHRAAPVVQAEVAKVLDQIAARMSFPVVQVAYAFTKMLFNRIFAGIDMRPEDAQRLRAAMRAGTPVLVPCHRSHLDYLLVSTVMYEHDLVVPHVVAGDNLSFWPLGPLFRRAGAFFIKRSFKGDRVFPVVFERYLRQLLRDGFPVEFFIEGGRSRTGKLLPARLGVLSMVMDAAARQQKDQEVTLLPIAVCYEQIAEERSYASELGGATKEREDLGQVVKAGRVIGRRFGKVYLRVGEPISTRALFSDLPAPWATLDRDHRREVLERTGERLLYRISERLVILPTGLTALALLAQSKRGVRMNELVARIERFERLLQRKGAEFGAGGSIGRSGVVEAVQRFEKRRLLSRVKDEEGDILQLLEAKRITLEYYKNSLLNFLVPESLFAASVRACREQAADLPRAELRRLFREQLFLLRYELTLDPDRSLESLEDEALRSLLSYGALREEADGRLVVVEPKLVTELAELTRNLLESYALVLRAARALRSRDLRPDQLPLRVQEVGKGLLAVDELSRPESLSLVNLTNAVQAWREEGVLQFRSDGGGLQFEDAVVQQYMDDLKRLVD